MINLMLRYIRGIMVNMVIRNIRENMINLMLRYIKGIMVNMVSLMIRYADETKVEGGAVAGIW